MKRLIRKSDEFNIFGIIFTDNAEAFEGNPEIMEVRDDFMEKKTIISGIITKLNKPSAEVFGVKKDTRDKLRAALKLAIGTGITVAKKIHDDPLLLNLKRYRSVLDKTNTHDLPEVADRVYTDLKLNETIAIGAGLTTEKLNVFKDIITNFRETIINTGYEFSSRKTARKEANRLVKVCSEILKDEMDAFAGNCKEEFPKLYVAYTTAREPRRSRKKKSVTNTTLATISGTVTESNTGLPLSNVSVKLLNRETVYTTNADGRYEINGVEAGICTVNCSAPDYDGPVPVTENITAAESRVINFSLVPTVIPQSNYLPVT